jgi:hypothetical protein
MFEIVIFINEFKFRKIYHLNNFNFYRYSNNYNNIF